MHKSRQTSALKKQDLLPPETGPTLARRARRCATEFFSAMVQTAGLKYLANRLYLIARQYGRCGARYSIKIMALHLSIISFDDVAVTPARSNGNALSHCFNEKTN